MGTVSVRSSSNKGSFTKDVLSEGGRGVFEKRTALYFPILFVMDFGYLKDEVGGFKRAKI